MISISLNNFKNVLSEKTYKFKRGDLFHLTGSSGAGKSTLLEAFEWVIFGKITGVKPRAHKDLIPRVHLIMDELSIIRDGNDLTVMTNSGKTLTSDAAQGHICSIFGDKDLWKCSSYLEQGNRNLLLTGSGEEKLRLLRDLTYGYGIGQEDDPEHYLTIISEALKKCQKEKATQSAIYDSFYAETETILEKFNESDNTWEAAEIEITDLKDDIKDTTKEIKSLSTKLNEQNHLKKEKETLVKRLNKNKEAQDSHIFDPSSYKNTKDELNEKISQNKDRIKELEFSSKIKQYLPYKYNSKEYESLKIQESEYKSWINKFNRLGIRGSITLKDLEVMLDNLREFNNWDRYTSLKEKQDYLVEMKDYLQTLEKDLIFQEKKKIILEKQLQDFSRDSLIFEKKRINQTITDFKKKKCFVCPTCQDSLFMNEKGSLSKADKVDIKTLEEDLKKTESLLVFYDQLEKFEKEEREISNDIKNTTKEIDTLNKSFPHDEFKKLQKIIDLSYKPEKGSLKGIKGLKEFDLEDLIDTFVLPVDDTQLKLFQNGEALAKLLGNNFNKFQKSPDDFVGNVSDISKLDIESRGLKNKLDLLESRKEEYQKLKNEEEVLTKNLDSIERRFDESISQEDLEELEDRLEEYRILELDYVKYIEMEKRMNSLSAHETKLNEINERLQRLETLFEVIKKLSIEPIELLIETLNYRLNNYLDRMFIDNPIRVLLSLYKTSSGPKSSAFTKIAVNLQIYHGENSYPNINSLSGGESDRVSLALTLAMASIVNTPLLFLDECMASLDSELREQCLTLIRETKTEDKIVIDVCHETVEGFHDRIVKI